MDKYDVKKALLRSLMTEAMGGTPDPSDVRLIKEDLHAQIASDSGAQKIGTDSERSSQPILKGYRPEF